MRRDIVEMYLSADGGHLPAALSLVEPLVTLFFYEMNFSGETSKSDRFLLSKGHGCLALYAVLIRKGFLPPESKEKVGHMGGALGWHPTGTDVPGMDVSSGSLGLGPSVAVGRALHAQRQGLGYRTYCVMGDGECNEGSVWEAAMAAAHKRLSSLYFLVDCNGYQANGKTSEVCNLEPFAEKWRAFGFDVKEVDLQDNPLSLWEALRSSTDQERPKVFLCYQMKGAGIPFVEGDSGWHSKNKLTEADRNLLLRWLES